MQTMGSALALVAASPSTTLTDATKNEVEAALRCAQDAIQIEDANLRALDDECEFRVNQVRAKFAHQRKFMHEYGKEALVATITWAHAKLQASETLSQSELNLSLIHI